MPLNIPMPDLPGNAFLKGMDSGGSLFTRLMEPRLEREKQKQLHEHFLQELMAKKEAAERSQAFQSRFDPQKQAIFQQRLLSLKQKNDPMYDFNKYKALEDMFKSRGGVNNMSGSMPNTELGQGLGVFSPEGLQTAQQTAQQNNDTEDNGIDYEMLKKHPALRGFFKSQFGVDPLAPTPQSPQEKHDDAIKLFEEKEKIKANKNSGEIATNKVLTQNQQAIQAIDTVIPMLDEFINNPDLVYGATDFSPSKKAAYNAKTGGMIDMLVAAQSLPQVKESVNLVEQQIRRGTGEKIDSYIKRLKDFKKDLLNRRGKSQGVVSSKKVNSAPFEDFSNMSDDELLRIAGGG